MALRLLLAAGAAMVLSWSPLLVVGALDPSANPIGLGLLAVAGTGLVALLIVAAAVAALVARLR